MSTLFDRICWAHENLDRVESKYCIVFEDQIDEPCKVLVPAPEWMAMALHGNLLPPVWVYHRLQYDDTGAITNGHILHETDTIGPMTEEEAIEYLIQKDIPIEVWISDSNRPRLKICSRDQIPSDRTFRNAWSLADV